MKCVIVEDQSPAQRVLKKYIEDYGNLELVAVFSDPLEALTFVNGNTIDLIFLDIHLPKLSGIDFIKALSAPHAIILTTAFSDYAVQSYELNVVDYLVKPFSFQRFVQAVSKIKSSTPEEQSPDQALHFFIKSGHEYVKIMARDIVYIHSDMDYTEVYTADGKKVLSGNTLTNWEDKLPETAFVRIHKSYIVNTRKITKVAGNQIWANATKVPIGRAYKETFFNQYVK